MSSSVPEQEGDDEGGVLVLLLSCQAMRLGVFLREALVEEVVFGGEEPVSPMAMARNLLLLLMLVLQLMSIKMKSMQFKIQAAATGRCLLFLFKAANQ